MNIHDPNYKMLTAGKVLKARRKELNKTVDHISQETKIQKRYLELIEEDRYSEFDQQIFVSGFIKIYADYLELNVEKVLAMYRRSIKEKEPTEKVKRKRNKQQIDLSKVLNPKLAAAAIVLIVILGVISYLAYQFYNFQKQPVLNVSSPTETGVTVTEPSLNISGSTEEGVILRVNDEPVKLQDDNTFAYEYQLSEGNNTVTIRAIKESNQNSESIKIFTIRYEPPPEPTDEEVQAAQDEQVIEPVEPEIQEFIFTVTTSEEAWILINADSKQEVAWVVPSGFNEKYVIKEKFEMSTGRPAVTKLTINGQEQDLKVNSESGVAGISCVVEENEVKCE